MASGGYDDASRAGPSALDTRKSTSTDGQSLRVIDFQDQQRLDEREDMPPSVSFHDEAIESHAKRSRRRKRARSVSISSIDASSEDDDDDDDDLGSMISDTEATEDDGSESDLDVDTTTQEDDIDETQSISRRSIADRFTPIVRFGRRKRRRRRSGEEEEEEAADQEGHSAKVYRRTPVFTGVIAPFSIMLEIPGFTSRWYVEASTQNGVPKYRANPAILDVGLAFSLACAVIANVAVLGRFAERLSPRRATLVAVIFFIVHDIINAVALIVFGALHAVDDGFTYSEAYWMTTAATAASLLCTTSLILDYISTKNFKNAGSGLTPKQAQLVMVIMAFLAYISISAMIFALIMPLPFLDSMYFMVESLATVGLGDIVPRSVGSRIAIFFVAPGGIVLLAVVVAISRQTIIEEFENAYKRRRAQFKQRAAQRQEQKRKNRRLNFRLRKGGGRGGAGIGKEIQSHLDSSGRDSTPTSDRHPLQPSRSPVTTSSGSRWFGGSWANGFSRKESIPDRFDHEKGASHTSHDVGKESTNAEDQDFLRKDGFSTLRRTDTLATTTSQLQDLETMLVMQRQEIEEDFKKFRKGLAQAERNEFWTKLGVAATLFAGFWTVGAAIFSGLEGWTYFEGFYFVFVVFTSMGYGDFAPKTSAGRAFFIVWGLLGVGTLTILFSVVSDAWTNRVQQRKLAGEKKKKKSRFAKVADKIRRKPKAEPLHLQEKGDSASPIPEVNEAIDVEQAGAIPPTGGILLDTSKDASTTDGSSGDPTSYEREGLLEDLQVDVNQLQLNFTTTAMEFHKSALEFMKHSRSQVVDVFRHSPEIQEVANKIEGRSGASRHKQMLTELDRKKIFDAVAGLEDPSATQSITQWVLIQDFEHLLHSLVAGSTKTQQELSRRQAAADTNDGDAGSSSAEKNASPDQSSPSEGSI